MRIGSVALAFREPRFIRPHLKHLLIPDEKLLLNSLKPWHGEGEDTRTEEAAKGLANILRFEWPTEHDQRNAGQEWHLGKDWILTLDPDEFMTLTDQVRLWEFLENAPEDAYVCQEQLTYWKNGYVIDPPEDYKQVIAVRPHVRFVDKRVVDCAYGFAPVKVHHFSWARTDKEIWSKITHYSHSEEFDTKKWFEEVWEKWTPEMEDLHPLTPEALKRAIPAKLPKELKGLWPT